MRVKKQFIVCMVFLAAAGHAGAQASWRVYFRDKDQVEYNPFDYLHPKAIERRILHGLDLCATSDFPLNDGYVAAVSNLSDSIKGQSRWMNALFVYTSEENARRIADLPFVKGVERSLPLARSSVCSSKDDETKEDTALSAGIRELLLAQLRRLGGDELRDSGLDGRGVRVAILDVGFKNYSEHPAFRAIKIRNGIVGTRDFVRKRDQVDVGMMHGTQVFSCLGGNAGSYRLGLATGADYLLARTESVTEFFNEEEFWLMAAEWADKNGADIINSSLGYTYQRYLPEDMNGRTAFVSKAAQIATDKGILVVSAAGNEGESSWKRVAAPGDAAGPLTVGGIDPETGIHIGFSSYGPSWDKRLKPEVCAYGKAVVASRKGYDIGEGTSFSSPLVAGFAACMKQRYPLMTNLALKELISRSGDLWPYFDYAHGYGVPHPVWSESRDTVRATFHIREENSGYFIEPLPEDSSQVSGPASDSTQFETETNKTEVAPYLFYHLKNDRGYIDKYFVLDFAEEENQPLFISRTLVENSASIALFYKGYYKEIVIRP